ncbi:IS4 family transposase [Umezawaea sp. Da 62-37]|uniref:IS4 family transposase n=1 Tax=Umezawaea sp. Da 62-37 TaxID=3075927 RepID=UPI0028F6C93E|nr:IS4 family transposase [Umezawaea sp. Da 62-37]WNV86696.1 IS4 family transposase [Umezawaea sp. Da 62-37]WNV86721.1 IS4 family transposase [Umezawaea sp. Da 62-37]
MIDDVSIGLLATVFPDVMVEAALDDCDAREVRTRALPARVVVLFTLAMWLHHGKGYVRVLTALLDGLRWARGGWDGYRVPTDGAISLARGRLGDAPMRALFTASTIRGSAAVVPEAAWRGLRKVAVDGTVFDVPSSTRNAEAFDIPAGGVHPQVRLVVLAECGTLGLVGAAFDSIGVGERELFERLLPDLGEGMLLTADRGFASYELWVKAAATGAHLLWRVSSAFALPCVEALLDGTYLSELRGRRRAERVTVRVIEYSVVDDVGVSEVFALITTLLDPVVAPALELARCYADRWDIEVLFRLVKVDLRAPGGVLRSGTPVLVRQELWALLCLYQALRTLIIRTAVIAALDPTRIRFLPALDAVKASVGRAFSPS